MKKFFKRFTAHSDYETYASSMEYITPNVCTCSDMVHYNPIPYDYSKDYLTFVALESGTFTFEQQNNNVISYSTDGGETWIVGNSVSVINGDKVLWKGTMTPSSKGIGAFSATGNFDVQGNVMSLLYGDNYKGQTDLTEKTYVFNKLFYQNAKVINAENLSLPATTLANNCYAAMFNRCTSLITAPSVLPATTLVTYCYNSMFSSCTSLTTPPKLPATTLADHCYNYMFNGCTGLATAPELPATTLETSCYNCMFQNCTNLNYIKAMFTTTPSTTYTQNWVSVVGSTGTFVKNSSAEWNVRGANGIPNGWTVQTASA